MKFTEIFESEEDLFTEQDINEVITELDEDDIQQIGDFIMTLIDEEYELQEAEFIKKSKVKKSAAELKKQAKAQKEYKKKNKAKMKAYAKKAAKMKKLGKTAGGKKIRKYK